MFLQKTKQNKKVSLASAKCPLSLPSPSSLSCSQHVPTRKPLFTQLKRKDGQKQVSLFHKKPGDQWSLCVHVEKGTRDGRLISYMQKEGRAGSRSPQPSFSAVEVTGQSMPAPFWSGTFAGHCTCLPSDNTLFPLQFTDFRFPVT